jgi:hypothetical protein
VWAHHGLICAGETYKNVENMTFAKGTALKDPAALFNSSLEGNTGRAVKFHEGHQIDEGAEGSLLRCRHSEQDRGAKLIGKIEHFRDRAVVSIVARKVTESDVTSTCGRPIPGGAAPRRELVVPHQTDLDHPGDQPNPVIPCPDARQSGRRLDQSLFSPIFIDKPTGQLPS